MRVYRPESGRLVQREEPVPEPQRGEVLVRVRATSLNYRDLLILDGDHFTNGPGSLIPVSDAAGEVAAVGEGVTRFAVGDRVINAFHSNWIGGRLPAAETLRGYGNGQDGWLAELPRRLGARARRAAGFADLRAGRDAAVRRRHGVDVAQRRHAAGAGRRRAHPRHRRGLAVRPAAGQGTRRAGDRDDVEPGEGGEADGARRGHRDRLPGDPRVGQGRARRHRRPGRRPDRRGRRAGHVRAVARRGRDAPRRHRARRVRRRRRARRSTSWTCSAAARPCGRSGSAAGTTPRTSSGSLAVRPIEPVVDSVHPFDDAGAAFERFRSRREPREGRDHRGREAKGIPLIG